MKSRRGPRVTPRGRIGAAARSGAAKRVGDVAGVADDARGGQLRDHARVEMGRALFPAVIVVQLRNRDAAEGIEGRARVAAADLPRAQLSRGSADTTGGIAAVGRAGA